MLHLVSSKSNYRHNDSNICQNKLKMQQIAKCCLADMESWICKITRTTLTSIGTCI